MGGTFQITRGMNMTLGATLSPPVNPWPAVFIGLLGLVAVEAFYAVSRLGGLEGWLK